MNMLWWWCGLGLILLCVEMVTGTLYLFCLGLAALFMALVTWLLPEMSWAWQALNYAVLSAITLASWRKFEKKKPLLRVGQSQGDEIGRQGVVIVAITPQQAGKIRFRQGVMGSKEWTAVADTAIAEQQMASVMAVEGNTLRVAPVSSETH